MSTEQQATVGTESTEAKPVSSQDQDTNAEVATSTETPAAGQQQEEEPTSTPSSPKHGSTLLANFPNFLKKPFEKKHEETTEAGDHVVTETSDEAAATPPNPDKSEKRLSRTLMDLLHKPKPKPENPSEPAPISHEDTAAAGVLSEEHTEAEQTQVPSPPSSPKEPIIDHLRKFFTKKPSDTAATDSTTPAAAQDEDVVEADHPTVPTDQPATTEDSKPTSLSRRFSKMAQNLTTRIKDTKKQPPKSSEGEPTTEATTKPTTDENVPEEQPSDAPATTHTADIEATNPPLPESVSNNGNGLPVPASA